MVGGGRQGLRMGGDNDRTLASHRPEQSDNLGFRHCVQVGCRFIEQQQFSGLKQRPPKGETPPLPAG